MTSKRGRSLTRLRWRVNTFKWRSTFTTTRSSTSTSDWDLLDELAKRGVLDDTLVIVASDHGEHLGDHWLFFHGCSLYRQLVNVLLVIVLPGPSAEGSNDR